MLTGIPDTKPDILRWRRRRTFKRSFLPPRSLATLFLGLLRYGRIPRRLFGREGPCLEGRENAQNHRCSVRVPPSSGRVPVVFRSKSFLFFYLYNIGTLEHNNI